MNKALTCPNKEKLIKTMKKRRSGVYKINPILEIS